MRRVLSLYRSSVGKKILMAATGVVFVLFVLAHMYGNLKAFYGPEKFNHYAVKNLLAMAHKSQAASRKCLSAANSLSR